MEENEVQETETAPIEETTSVETPEPYIHPQEDVNLQRMREASAEKDRRIQELEAAQRSATVPVKNTNLIGDDELVEGKDFNKVQDKIQRLEELAIKSQLSIDHQDYNKVMTKKNIEKLIDSYPELADTLHANKDKYTQYKSAYRMIKQFGIYQEEGPSKEKQVLNTNVNKPIPSNSIGNKSTANPLTHAKKFEDGPSEAFKRELREANERARMNY